MVHGLGTFDYAVVRYDALLDARSQHSIAPNSCRDILEFHIHKITLEY